MARCTCTKWEKSGQALYEALYGYGGDLLTYCPWCGNGLYNITSGKMETSGLTFLNDPFEILLEVIKEMFPDLNSCSFDKGFYSPANKIELAKILDNVILPKKGRLTIEERSNECSEDFLQGKRKHSAVESGINALENHGLDRCPDHAITGFRRYVALAVFARNLQNLGNIIQQKKIRKLKRATPVKFRLVS